MRQLTGASAPCSVLVATTASEATSRPTTWFASTGARAGERAAAASDVDEALVRQVGDEFVKRRSGDTLPLGIEVSGYVPLPIAPETKGVVG